jgi:hypothetical protein
MANPVGHITQVIGVDLDVQVFDFKQRHRFSSTLIRHPKVRGQSQSLEG